MAGNNNCGRLTPRAQIVLDDGAKRRPVQMIEMGVRHEHQIDGRKIAHLQPWAPQALQHKKPAREVRVNHRALAANLNQEAGVTDESNTEFSVGGKAWFMSFAA
jgi:hypothetical protein